MDQQNHERSLAVWGLRSWWQGGWRVADEQKSAPSGPPILQTLYVEKRRHKRVSTIIMADLYAKDQSGRMVGRGCITDVSVSGIQIETKEPLQIEGDFVVRFYLPNGMGFENLEGRIVRTSKASITNVYGIKFTKISFFDRLRLWWYIATR